MAITFATLGRKLENGADAIPHSAARITYAATESLASQAALAYRAATGGDGKLSGTATSRSGRGGSKRGTGRQAPVSAKAKDVRRYSEGTYVGLGIATGPWGLIERDIRPHLIGVHRNVVSQGTVAKAARGARRQQRRGQDVSVRSAVRAARAGRGANTAGALKFPGAGHKKRGYAMSAKHPGTTGKDVFSSAIRAAGPKAAKRLLGETTKQMLNAYRRPA